MDSLVPDVPYREEGPGDYQLHSQAQESAGRRDFVTAAALKLQEAHGCMVRRDASLSRLVAAVRTGDADKVQEYARDYSDWDSWMHRYTQQAREWTAFANLEAVARPGSEMTASYQPAPAPFPVGVEVRYSGPDEPEWPASGGPGLLHGTMGLVVANHPGVPGRAAGSLGTDDPGFRTVHGYSEVAYLRPGPTMVAAEAGRGGIRAADQFLNLEPEGVPDDVARERLAAYGGRSEGQADAEAIGFWRQHVERHTTSRQAEAER